MKTFEFEDKLNRSKLRIEMTLAPENEYYIGITKKNNTLWVRMTKEEFNSLIVGIYELDKALKQE